MATPSSSPQGRNARASASARNAAEWFRQLDHLVHTARSMGADSPQVAQQRERLAEGFAGLVEFHAPMVFRVSPLEIWLRDELVVKSPEGSGELEPIERRLPFLLYRDGVRGISIDAAASRDDARTLVQAIVRVVAAPSSDDGYLLAMKANAYGSMRASAAAIDNGGPGSSQLARIVQQNRPHELAQINQLRAQQ